MQVNKKEDLEIVQFIQIQPHLSDHRDLIQVTRDAVSRARDSLNKDEKCCIFSNGARDALKETHDLVNGPRITIKQTYDAVNRA